VIPARILGTAHLLPGRVVTTEELAEETRPGGDPTRLIAATGVRERRWAEPGTRAADVGAEVLRAALDNAGLPAEALERVIFVSASGGDWLIASTATAILAALGLDGKADGFDLCNA
jgi:3-oxoacyl-[acyl-carrier-protein] synthase-3